MRKGLAADGVTGFNLDPQQTAGHDAARLGIPNQRGGSGQAGCDDIGVFPGKGSVTDITIDIVVDRIAHTVGQIVSGGPGNVDVAQLPWCRIDLSSKYRGGRRYVDRLHPGSQVATVGRGTPRNRAGLLLGQLDRQLFGAGNRAHCTKLEGDHLLGPRRQCNTLGQWGRKASELRIVIPQLCGYGICCTVDVTDVDREGIGKDIRIRSRMVLGGGDEVDTGGQRRASTGPGISTGIHGHVGGRVGPGEMSLTGLRNFEQALRKRLQAVGVVVAVTITVTGPHREVKGVGTQIGGADAETGVPGAGTDWIDGEVDGPSGFPPDVVGDRHRVVFGARPAELDATFIESLGRVETVPTR